MSYRESNTMHLCCRSKTSIRTMYEQQRHHSAAVLEQVLLCTVWSVQLSSDMEWTRNMGKQMINIFWQWHSCLGVILFYSLFAINEPSRVLIEISQDINCTRIEVASSVCVDILLIFGLIRIKSIAIGAVNQEMKRETICMCDPRQSSGAQMHFF